MPQPDIVAIGEPMLEFNAEEEGALSEVTRFLAGWGGDTSNFCIAASRAGGKAGYLTRIGSDEFGNSLLALWKREGIDTSRVVRDPEAYTAAYFISRLGREHFFTYFRKDSAASRMQPEFLPREYIAQARLLHVSGISQAISTSACDTVFAAIGIARQAGRLVSYDPNFRPRLWPVERARAVIHETCRLADLVFPSLEEARHLTGLDRAEEIARFYLGLGPKVVLLKMGAEGSLLATADGIERQPSFQVASIDMSGAGDTFDGAFVTAFLEGRPPSACARFANAAAALTTTGLGCVRPIPRREEIEKLLSRTAQG
ncbi:MAG: sugar kinase [Desulfobacterales bacterium]